MAKKLRVKDLKHDEVRDSVVHATEETLAFMEKHRRSLLIGVAVLLGLVLAWNIGRLVVDRRTNARQAALGAALEKERLALEAASGETSASTATRPVVTLEEARSAFREVADKYGSSSVGPLARLHLGVNELRLGDAKEAAATLNSLVSDEPDGWVTPHALAALATAQEESGSGEDAKATLERLAAREWASFPAAVALLRGAELAERQGRTADANATYKRVAEDPAFTNTPQASLAAQALTRLGADSPTN